METVNMRLDHRWYIGYDLGEPVPNHSSLSKIRERYGWETFQRFFEHVVELCIEAGLVWGKKFYLNATKVRAVEIQFQYLKEYQPFAEREMRVELANRLNDIPGINIPNNKLDLRPSFPITVLTNQEGLKSFLAVLDWIVDQYRSS